ncbi:hypothetical protein G6F31_014638 [Rhizopus arrhizus]|nr:hypothetical protein G6F31_014638 [Rhizopus arrhizus]
MEGIAWASGVGRLATVALGAWLVLRKHRLVAWPAWRALQADLAAIGKIALPAALTTLATPAAVIFTVSTYAGFGPSVMAGATVVDRVLQLAYSLFFVLPGAIGPILGQNLGSGQWERVKQTVRLTARWALCYGFVAATVLAVLAPWVPDVFQVTGPGRDLIIFFCRYGSFAWAVNSLFFVSIAVFNNGSLVSTSNTVYEREGDVSVAFRASGGGTYQVAVNADGPSAFGPYRLRAEKLKPYDGKPLVGGGEIVDMLGGDSQDYTLQVEKEGLYEIRLVSDAFDPVLKVSGQGVDAENDDSSDSTNSRLSLSLKPGKYTLTARGLGDGVTGMFTLSATRIELPGNLVAAASC